MATGHMDEIKLIEGLTIAAETLGGEIIFFSLSGKKNALNIFSLYFYIYINIFSSYYN